MSLKKLIADLKKNMDELNERYPPEKEVTYEENHEKFFKQHENDRKLRNEVEKLPEGRIIFPNEFGETEVELEKLSSGKYHLLISGFPEKTLSEVQPVLDELFRMSKNLRVRRNVADVKYSVFWTPEDFQKEKKLTGLSSDDKIAVRARAYEVDPTQVRIGYNGHSHSIEASIEENKLYITASEKYRKHLEGLVKTLNMQYARLNLSSDDAKKLLERAKERVRSGLAGNDFVKRLEGALKPQEKQFLSLEMSGAICLENKDIIEINIPTREMLHYIEDLEKGLLDIPLGQETGIIELSKTYGFFGNRKLEDLQKFAGEVQKMDLGIVYDKPLLSSEEAKKLLDMEVKEINAVYRNIFCKANTHEIRPFVKRLAEEHFGKDITKDLEEATQDEYIRFLESRGYVPSERFEKEQANERHLLKFFNQSYAINPGTSVEKFRDFYKNKKPEIDISAKARKDASELKNMKIPEKSKLYSFGIVEHMKPATPYSNDLVISRTLVKSSDIHFWCRTSLDSPLLLPLQEYVCEQMGIKFR